jgi:hypothetical protein
MKLLGAISLGLAAAFFAIGINESISRGVQDSYFLFMFSLMFLFSYGYVKRHEIAKANEAGRKEAEKPVVKPKKKK